MSTPRQNYGLVKKDGNRLELEELRGPEGPASTVPGPPGDGVTTFFENGQLKAAAVPPAVPAGAARFLGKSVRWDGDGAGWQPADLQGNGLLVNAGAAGSTYTLDCTNKPAIFLAITLNSDVVVNVTNMSPLQSITVEVTQGTGGDRKLTFNPTPATPNAAGLTLSPLAGAVDSLSLYSPDGVNLRGFVAGLNLATPASPNANSDAFTSTTAQNLKSGGDGAKANGWRVRNTANADAMDVNTTTAGFLTIDLSATSSGASPAAITAPYAYKLITGDFDVETFLVDNADASYEQGGFLIASDSNERLYLTLVNYYDAGSPHVAARSSNASTEATVGTDAAVAHKRFRITRTGNSFALYRKLNAADAWTSAGTISRSDLGSTVRVGLLAAPNNTTNNYVARFDYLAFA